MALVQESSIFDSLTADPGSPVEGQLWYNVTEHAFKAFINGTVVTLITGIATDDHETLDTLVHNLAETSHRVYGYTGDDVTSVTVWDSIAQTTKIRETTLSYTGSDVTQIVVVQYNALGTPVATLTKSFAYDANGNVTSSGWVRS